MRRRPFGAACPHSLMDRHLATNQDHAGSSPAGDAMKRNWKISIQVKSGHRFDPLSGIWLSLPFKFKSSDKRLTDWPVWLCKKGFLVKVSTD